VLTKDETSPYSKLPPATQARQGGGVRRALVCAPAFVRVAADARRRLAAACPPQAGIKSELLKCIQEEPSQSITKKARAPPRAALRRAPH
jgi:hypothetical protein